MFVIVIIACADTTILLVYDSTLYPVDDVHRLTEDMFQSQYFIISPLEAKPDQKQKQVHKVSSH